MAAAAVVAVVFAVVSLGLLVQLLLCRTLGFCCLGSLIRQGALAAGARTGRDSGTGSGHGWECGWWWLMVDDGCYRD